MNIDDLLTCDTEPIHVPGAIQPHGVLLAVSEPDLVVRVCSRNTASTLAVDSRDVLGGSLSAVLGTDSATRVADSAKSERLASRSLVPVSVDGVEWDATMFRSERLLVLELEPAPHRQTFGAVYASLREAMVRIQSAGSIAEVAEVAVREIHRVCDFDRVMVYRFAPDQHGEVVAEVVRPDWESFLGLHFPASDIPTQARALYERNWIRTIAAVDYVPVPLVGEPDVDAAALDLSDSVLRSVSPVHLEYLANMQVASSTSVSLLLDGRLWGLIACHHGVPRALTSDERSACELIGVAVSQTLAGLETRDAAAVDAERDAEVDELLEGLGEEPDVVAALRRRRDALLSAGRADGVLVQLGGSRLLHGITPADPHRVVTTMLGSTQGVEAPEEGVGPATRWSEELAAMDLSLTREVRGETCGALVVALSSKGDDVLAWFRGEVTRDVTWAGDPDDAVKAVSGGGRLAPRGSFAAWRQTVRGTSAPWTATDRRAAGRVARQVAEVVLARATVTEARAAELARSNEDLEAFARMASHSLKEPLRGIASSAAFVLEDSAPRLGVAGVERLRTVQRLAARMDDLLDSLMHYSRVGGVEPSRTSISLDEVLDEVLDSLGAFVSASGAQVRRSPLPTVQVDRVRLAEVLQNLLSNALRYSPGFAPVVEVGAARVVPPDGATAVEAVYVRDHGIGIPPEQQEEVFGLFCKLHGSGRYGEGAGVGLAIARRIVERHGGRLWLESEGTGRGSTFWFTLPAPGEGEAPPSTADVPSERFGVSDGPPTAG